MSLAFKIALSCGIFCGSFMFLARSANAKFMHRLAGRFGMIALCFAFLGIISLLLSIWN